MAENNNLLKERLKILGELNKLAQTGASKTSDAYKNQLIELKKVNTELNKISETQQTNRDTAKSMESFASGLSSVYKTQSSEISKQASAFYEVSGNIETALARGSELSDKNKQQARIVNNMLANYKKQSDISAEIAQLGDDELIRKNELQNKFDDISVELALQQTGIDAMTRIGQDFLDIQGQIEESIETQRQDASELSNLSREQKDILEGQAEVFESMKKKVDGLGSTLTTFLKRPQAIIGGLFIGAGVLVDKFAAVNKELGNGFDILNSTTASAGVLGFVFDDTAGTVKALASEFGGTEAATFQTQANIGLMATNMGISNLEAVSLSGSFARMNGGSTEIAADMVKTTQQFAKQNGIIPSALMADLAGSAEEFALFGKDGGDNILAAAGYAQKLGTNMSTLSGISEGLLDFESSITKELELGALLGKNINLNKARELAYAGDIEGATKATLAELGGIEEFNRMDYFQKKATADLLGVSVAELQKMATNQEKAGQLGSIMNEKFSMIGETIDAGLNQYLGTGLKGLGGMITMSGELGRGFQSLGIDMGGIAKKIGGAGKKLLMWPVKKIGGLFGKGKSITNDVQDKITKSTETGAKTPKKSGGGLKSLASGLKEMGSGKVLFGALNLIPTALGFVAILPGLPGMLGVSLVGVGAGAGLTALGRGLTQMGTPQVLFGAANLALSAVAFTLMTLGSIGLAAIALGGIPAGAGLSALAAGLSAFGASAPATIVGIGLLALLGVALIPVTYALSLLTPVIESLGNVISGVLGGVASIVTAVSDGMVGMLDVITPEKALSMLALASAFPILAAGITALGIASFLGGGTVIGFLEDLAVSAQSLSGGTANSIQTTAAALVSMGSGLMMVNQQLDRLSVDKLDALSDFSMKLSIGGAVSAVGESIGGLVDSVAGVIGGNSEDKEIPAWVEELKTTLRETRDVYIDGTKITAVISNKVDKIGSNSFSIG